jgi:hypothetical protein
MLSVIMLSHFFMLCKMLHFFSAILSVIILNVVSLIIYKFVVYCDIVLHYIVFIF